MCLAIVAVAERGAAKTQITGDHYVLLLMKKIRYSLLMTMRAVVRATSKRYDIELMKL